MNWITVIATGALGYFLGTEQDKEEGEDLRDALRNLQIEFEEKTGIEDRDWRDWEEEQ